MKCETVDWGLLVVRFGLALTFIVHGGIKLATVPATMLLFDQMGLPGWFGVIVGVVELLGGTAMLLGMYTRYAGYALSLVMLGAIFSVTWKTGFVSGWESEFMLFIISLGIAFAGPGKYSVQLSEEK